MELAVCPSWVQQDDVSDLGQELMFSGTPTLHQGNMGEGCAWETRRGGIRWWRAAEEKGESIRDQILSMTYVMYKI